MKDQILMSVTEILYDSTGIWAGDLCEFEIHSRKLDDFLKQYGKKGAAAICEMLDALREQTLKCLEEMEGNNLEEGKKK